MDVEKLVRVYIKIRDARSEATRIYEEQDKKFKTQLDRVGLELLRFLQDSKQEAARTSLGTVYREEVITPTGADWDAFYRWIAENDAFDFLERRIKRTSVKEYMEANDGAIPPGVSIFREYVARVRRS